MRLFNRVVGSLVLIAGLSLGTTACIKNIPTHPGAVNPVDNALYDGILTARATLEAAKTQFQGQTQTVAALNAIIPAFNKLEVGYAAYHTALVAGKSDPATLNQLQQQLNAVVASLASIVKTAPPAPVPAK
jgi:outer membrane murein-binding lipoprotein Lpp